MLDDQAEPDPDGHANSDVFYLWPTSLPAFQFWQKCQSQWLEDWNGRTGLNYAGVDVVLRRNGFRGKAADRMFAAVQHMEAGALEAYLDERKKRKR